MADIEKGNSNWGDYNYVVSGSGLIGKEVRIGFIRKVYLIVSAQLVFTFGICSIFVLVPEVKEFTRSAAGFYLYILS
jgi:FtsH-binding integral membrane protein